MSSKIKYIMDQFSLGDEKEENIKSNQDVGENGKKENELNNNKRPRRDNFGYFINVENEDSSSSDKESTNKKENDSIKNTKNEESYHENSEDNFDNNIESINEDEINRKPRNIPDNLVTSFRPKPVPGSPKFCKKISNNSNIIITNEDNIEKESNSENDHNKKSTSSIIKYINTQIKVENPTESSVNSNNNFIYESKYKNDSSNKAETSHKYDNSSSYHIQVNKNEEINQKDTNKEDEDEDGAFLMREVINRQNRVMGNEKAKLNNNNNLQKEEHETISTNNKNENKSNNNEYKIENIIYHDKEMNSINKEEESNKETLNEKINNLNDESGSNYLYEQDNNNIEKEYEKNNSSSHYYYKENFSPCNNEQREINKLNESEIISELSTNNKMEVIYSRKKLNNNKKNIIPFMNYNNNLNHGSQIKNQKNNSKYTSPKRNEKHKYNFNNNKNLTPSKNMKNYIKNIDKSKSGLYTPTNINKINYNHPLFNKDKNKALTPEMKNEKKYKKCTSSSKGRLNMTNEHLSNEKNKINILYNNSKKNIYSYNNTKKINNYSGLMISKTTNKKIEDTITKFATNGKISIVGFIKCLFELNIINEIFKSKYLINNLDIEELRNIIKEINEKNINKIKEVEFIEQFWFILNPSTSKYIPIEFTSKILKILFSANSNIKEITNSIVSLLNKYNSIINNGIYLSPLRNKKYNKNEKWPLPKFIKVFLNLKNKPKINKNNNNINDYNIKKNDSFFNKYNNHIQRNDYNEDNSFDSSNTRSTKKYKKIQILNKTVDSEAPYNLYNKNTNIDEIQINISPKSSNKNILRIPKKNGTPNRHLTNDENIEKHKGNNIIKKKYILDRKRYIPSPKKQNSGSFINKTQNNSPNRKLDLIEDAFITIHIKIPNGELKPFEIHNTKLEDIIESVRSFCKTYNLDEEMKSLILQKVLEYRNSFFIKNTFNKFEIKV